MAERASRKPKRRAKANGHAKPGHNSGEVPAEVIDRWWAKLEAAQKAIDKAAKPLQARKGEMSALKKACKADGVDVPALLDAMKAHEGDHLEVVTRYANTGKYLRAHQSPLGVQMNLFPLEPIPEISRAAIAGKRQGLRGGSIDENPYPPGSELHVAYVDAWHVGQEEVRSSVE